MSLKKFDNKANIILKSFKKDDLYNYKKLSQLDLSTKKFAYDIVSLLKKKQSTNISDKQLEKYLKITPPIYHKSINGTQYRIMTFRGILPEMYGNIGAKWNYVQWWNKNECYAQLIQDKVRHAYQ